MSWWRLRKCRYRLCSLAYACDIKFAYPRIAQRTRVAGSTPARPPQCCYRTAIFEPGLFYCDKKNHPPGVILVNAISRSGLSRPCMPALSGRTQRCCSDTSLPATGSANPALAAATTDHRRALPRWRGSVPACAGWSGPAYPDSRSFPDSSRWRRARQPGLR